MIIYPWWVRSAAVISGGGSSWPLDLGHYEDEYIAMEIVAPRAGLNTSNRYYKTYPGLLYDVPFVILGGRGPFKATVITGHVEMELTQYWWEEATFHLRWADPKTSGSPHAVTLRIEDAAGFTLDVSYSLTVTTTGIYFVDRLSGSSSNSNSGAINSRWLDMRGWYKTTKADSTYAGAQIIYMDGLPYFTADCPIEDVGQKPSQGWKPGIVRR